MTSTLDLARDLAACPSCWQNFIREFNEQWELTANTRGIEMAIAEIDHFRGVNIDLQRQWNARLNGENWDHSDSVEFNTDQDKLMFIIKWS